jgi:hypothetical protein
MELVLVELDAGAELDATECLEVADAEPINDMDLDCGRDRRMERSRNRRYKSEWQEGGKCGGSAGERRKQSSSHEQGRRGQAESVQG